MHRRPPSRFRRLRAFVVWALVALLPLQAIAASMLAALGPLHTHRAKTTIIVLEDVRRASTHTAALPMHVATAFGHFHSGAPQRHHHASGDASVQVVDDGSQSAIDGEEMSAANLAATVALLPDLAVWLGRASGEVHAARAAWAPQTHEPEPLERPPRAA